MTGTTMPDANTSSRKPLWIIMGCFSVVLIANAALVYYALGSWTGLETKQPFVKGLAYNSNLQGAKNQQELGWQVKADTSFVAGQSMSGTSQILFLDKHDQPISDLDVRMVITRPTHEGFDQTLNLRAVGKGIYLTPFTLPLKGQWDFRIVAQRGDAHYQHVERIVTP